MNAALLRRPSVAHRSPWRGRSAQAAWTLAGLVCLCVAAPSRADETRVYEWRDARGAVSYAQFPPPPGTKDVTSREIETRSFTPAQRIAIRAHLAGLQARELDDARRFEERVTRADEAVRSALQRLASTEDAVSAGRAPVPDEHVGIADGGTRLRSEYFARQMQLEGAVLEARARLDDAYRRRREIEP